jgi:type I restriction enzyme M protein
VKGGAGQYFTPRPLIDAIVDCIQPKPGEVIADPACGTGGFLLSVHRYIEQHYKLDKDQKKALRYDSLRGIELVDGVARLTYLTTSGSRTCTVPYHWPSDRSSE